MASGSGRGVEKRAAEGGGGGDWGDGGLCVGDVAGLLAGLPVVPAAFADGLR